MAELDQTARYALKMAPAEVVAWLLPTLDADLAFSRWLDTETIAFPGEPGRRCDTVAELVSRSGRSPPWALVLEVEAWPRATMLDRVLEYLVRVMRRLRHGPRRRDRYLVAGAVIFLHGRKKSLKLRMRLPGTDVGLAVRVRSLSLACESAAVSLERIGRGELGRTVLPWVPLMERGGEAATVAEWVRLAVAEPDDQHRKDYAGLALVFAESAGCLPIWKKYLEGFDMWKSQVIAEWRAEGREQGRLEEKQNDLLLVLKERHATDVPADLTQLIQQTTDLAVLSKWLIAAAKASSLDEFRTAIQPAAPPNGHS
jgi:hypothetical protein